MNRVMLGSVIVNGVPFATCPAKSGITEPLEAMTLPYRVTQITVEPLLRDLAIATFSIIALEMPIAFIG